MAWPLVLVGSPPSPAAPPVAAGRGGHVAPAGAVAERRLAARCSRTGSPTPTCPASTWAPMLGWSPRSAAARWPACSPAAAAAAAAGRDAGSSVRSADVVLVRSPPPSRWRRPSLYRNGVLIWRRWPRRRSSPGPASVHRPATARVLAWITTRPVPATSAPARTRCTSGRGPSRCSWVPVARLATGRVAAVTVRQPGPRRASATGGGAPVPPPHGWAGRARRPPTGMGPACRHRRASWCSRSR